MCVHGSRQRNKARGACPNLPPRRDPDAAAPGDCSGGPSKELTATAAVTATAATITSNDAEATTTTIADDSEDSEQGSGGGMTPRIAMIDEDS